MNANERGALWQRLAEAGLVTGATPAPAGDGTVWYIRAMLGAAAWIAAVFLLAFIGMALHDLVRTNVAKIVTGLVVCAGAAVMLRVATGPFAGQLALALSLTGQALFAFGMLNLFDRGRLQVAPAMFVVAAVEALLVIAVPNVVHRVICTIAAALALAYGLWSAGLGTLGLPLAAAAFVVVELDEARLARWPRLYPAIGIGLALAIAAILPVQAAGDEWSFWRTRDRDLFFGPRFADAAMGAVFFGAAPWLLAKAGVARGTSPYVAAIAGALALALVSVGVPGLSAALLILLIGFATSQRLLTGLGTLALLAALARFYYALSATLLVKSAVLLAAAVALLLFWAVLRHAGKENDHA
ncbi:MAG: DUF4401 domain-containing protein [Burkholderiales bacterium]